MVHFTGQRDQSYITLLTLPVLSDVCLTHVESGFNKHNMVIDGFLLYQYMFFERQARSNRGKHTCVVNHAEVL